MSELTIKFTGHSDPLLERLRVESRNAGFAGIDGIQNYVAKKYNATILAEYDSYFEWSEIHFADERTMLLFILGAKCGRHHDVLE